MRLVFVVNVMDSDEAGATTYRLAAAFAAVGRDGYVIAQEYLPAAADGDTRLFLMNGLPLRNKGKYAAFRRVPTGAVSAATFMRVDGSAARNSTTRCLILPGRCARGL